MKNKHFLMLILFILSMIGSTSSLYAQVPTAPPVAEIIGEVDVSFVTSARVTGRIDPKGGNVNVSFEYGIANDDGTVTFTLSAIPIPQDVSGDTPVDVTAELPGLSQGTSYKVRIRAQGTAGMVLSAEKDFRIPFLSSLDRGIMLPRPLADKTFTVNIVGDIINGTPQGRWRFAGDTKWTPSGEPGKAVNLVSGTRDVEFIPLPGLIHPATVSVDIGDGDGQTMILDTNSSRYFSTPTQNGGSIQIILKPDHIAATNVPSQNRAQWKFAGESAWRNSHDIVTRAPGGYEVRFKPLDNFEKLPSLSISINPGDEVTRTIAYVSNVPFGDPLLTQPKPIDNNTGPYRYLGLIRSKAGVGTGFAVDERVVATASHVIFNDMDLKFNDDLQWLFQRVGSRDLAIDPGFFPVPQKPRGYYAHSGYAAARDGAEFGVGTELSQTLDFAALWFAQEKAGRGGYSGYLASDKGDENEFLNSGIEKILAGFPVSGGFAGFESGKYHAVEFTTALKVANSSGVIWSTEDAQGYSGMSGGPLFVKHTNGSYYPAAIYLGGSTQTIVRAIDTDVVRLFRLAKDSSFSEKQNVNTGMSVTGGKVNTGKDILRNIKVIIEPAEAREKLARWSLDPDDPFQASGGVELDRKVGVIYQMKFSKIDGYPEQDVQHVNIPENAQGDYVYTYIYKRTPSAEDNLDPDNDGQNNIQEYIAGTDPANASDFFKINMPKVISRNPVSVTVVCDGKAGRKYTLLRSTTLSGTWERLAAEETPTVDKTVTLVDPDPPSDKSFYRIEVSFP